MAPAPCSAEGIIKEEKRPKRRLGWLSRDRRAAQEWVADVVEAAEREANVPLAPSVQEFRQHIDQNGRLRFLANSMFQEIKPRTLNELGRKQVRSLETMYRVFNYIVRRPPTFTETQKDAGIVGLPFRQILDIPMATTSGFAFFLDSKVNECLKKIFAEWGKFLETPASANVLNDGPAGWFSAEGRKALEDEANAAAGTSLSFEETFECDPSQEHMGFSSWDNFFTRKFREDVRPVADPDNDDVVVVACESLPYKIHTNAQAQDDYWVKGERYSLRDMFDDDPCYKDFIGSTVYQAFLSPESYHRWHAPVSGTVVHAYHVNGTYYSEPPYELTAVNDGVYDTDNENEGQTYLAEQAARAVVLIKADNPKLGVVAFIGIGMWEVSSCDVTVQVGDTVKKGDQLGMFHFGGSTHALVFERGVRLRFAVAPGDDRLTNKTPVRSRLAVVEN